MQFVRSREIQEISLLLQTPSRVQRSQQPKFPYVLVLLLMVVLFAGKPFIEFTPDGIPRLATWREEKLAQELEDLEGAEQYVLLAEEHGNYPCYSCIGAGTIYLEKGHVWKYGITTKGASGRYGNFLIKQRLVYIIQFKGTIEECLKEERRKIYHYALFPENLKRTKPLIRPPGNKKDS